MLNITRHFCKLLLCSRCGLFSRKIQSEQVFFVFFVCWKKYFNK